MEELTDRELAFVIRQLRDGPTPLSMAFVETALPKLDALMAERMALQARQRNAPPGQFSDIAQQLD